MTLPASERSTASRIGAYAMHAKHDVLVTSAAGRKAAWDRFEREVDPEGVLAAPERARRADMARKAHYTRLGLASAKARRRRKNKAVA